MSDTVVLVENLTRVANLKESLNEFLAFCGPITKLTLHKTEGQETSYAVVSFSTGAAARTAILMNNTPFNGNNITVRNPAAGFVVPESDDADERAPVSAPSEESSMPPSSPEEIIEDLLKQGKELGAAAIAQAQALDQQHGITATLAALTEQAVQQAQAKFNELDQELHITAQATALGQQIEQTFAALDEQYKIKETTQTMAGTVAQATGTAFNDLAQTVGQLSEDPKVKEGVASLEAFGSQAGQTIQQVVEVAIAQTKQ